MRFSWTPKKQARKNIGKEKLGSDSEICFIFYYSSKEFIKMMKNARMLVNPQKNKQEKNQEKKKAAAKVVIPLVFFI